MAGEGWEGKIIKMQEEIWGDGYLHYLDCGDGSVGVYLYLKVHEILTLNMLSSLYVNCISIKYILFSPK